MTAKDLERLFDYSYWANKKLLNVIAQLTPEEFTREVAGSYGSVRTTLVHMLSAEWGWLERCGGETRGPLLKPEDYPTLQSVVDRWTTVERNMREFLRGLKDDDVQRVLAFTLGQLRSGVMGEMLQHAANHASHHRGQVSLLLRALGHAPGNVDMLLYDAERRGAAAV